jgi:Fe-S-cluster containining protein
MRWGSRVLRRQKDPVFGRACRFLNLETRGCTIYHARPKACREYPGRSRCSYYDVLRFEREIQQDQDIVPIVRLTFLKRAR